MRLRGVVLCFVKFFKFFVVMCGVFGGGLGFHV